MWLPNLAWFRHFEVVQDVGYLGQCLGVVKLADGVFVEQ